MPQDEVPCEVHNSSHQFVQCDEWGYSCVCGAVAPGHDTSRLSASCFVFCASLMKRGAVYRKIYAKLRHRDGSIGSRFSGTPVLFVSFQSACMRNRNIIERESEGFDPKTMPKPKEMSELQLEVSLDIRDLLQKLVEKKSRKVISTEVSMSDSEQKLLDGLDVIEG